MDEGLTALAVVDEFQEGLDGWDDQTMVKILCEFIDQHNLTHELLGVLEKYMVG